MRGRESRKPVKLDDFDTYATPLRHLDYLLEDIQPAVLLYEHGIMINVPAPGRFAIHKCIVSQRRTAAEAAKTRKDLSKAAQIFRVLLEIRPAEFTVGHEAARTRGGDFAESFGAGLRLIDDAVGDPVRDLLGFE